MKQMKKIIALALALVLAMSFAGCRLQIEKELATVNGNMVSAGEYKYYLESIKEQMLAGAGTQDAETFWSGEIDGKKAADVAKERAIEEMIRVEIAVSKATEKGIALDSVTANQIEELVKATDAQTKAQVDSIKDKTGLSDQGLKKLLEKTTLASLYAQDIQATEPEKLEVADADANAKYKEDYARVKHILIMSEKQEEAPVADSAEATADPAAKEADAKLYKAEQKLLADEVLAKAKAGSNFEALIKEYGEDPGMESNPDGYVIDKTGAEATGAGTMVAEFTQGSFSVGVGEVTDLVESSYGWHIIKRYALPTSGEVYDSAIQNVKNSLMQDKYNELMDSYKSDFDIQINQKVVDKIKVN